MSKVINEFHIKNMAVLILDSVPEKIYNQLLIDGERYKPLPVFDAKNCIAIESNGSFLNKNIEFILS